MFVAKVMARTNNARFRAAHLRSPDEKAASFLPGGFLIPSTQAGVPVRRSKERGGTDPEKSGMGPLCVFLHYGLDSDSKQIFRPQKARDQGQKVPA